MLKQTIEIFEVLDRSDVNGRMVKEVFEKHGAENVEIRELVGEEGKTDFIKIVGVQKSNFYWILEPNNCLDLVFAKRT